MPMLVKVVTDHFALRRRYSRLKEGFSHTEDDDEVISTVRKAIEAFSKRTIQVVIDLQI